MHGIGRFYPRERKEVGKVIHRLFVRSNVVGHVEGRSISSSGQTAAGLYRYTHWRIRICVRRHYVHTFFFIFLFFAWLYLTYLT